ncbi:MAG: molybdopterin-guanine dinucleotide biosynthesis protein B [Dehalococcoidales bacterium]|nr:molybdopterin-guanine dinucleotide biosynthesis protein B [Dehalococcoidales bacterium]
MPAIVSFAGNSGSGKTTLMEKLIRELKAKGYRVATIKHTFHSIALDQPGKDSWRYIEAGSDAAVAVSREMMLLVKPLRADVTLEEVARVVGEDYDIILVEGFKRDNAPKVLVHRGAAGPLLSDLKEVIAIATDEPLKTKTRQFSLDDARGIAAFLEREFIKSPR